LRPKQRDVLLANEANFLKKIREYLDQRQTAQLTQQLIDSGKKLVGTFQVLKRIDGAIAQEYSDVLLSCQSRTTILLTQLETSHDENLYLLKLHDQLLALFLALYSAYDRFYTRILEKILYAYLLDQDLISEVLALPEPFQYLVPPMKTEEVLGIETRTTFRSYDFPIILRLLIKSSGPMTELYAIATDLSLKDAERKRVEFGDNLIHSTDIRNRIAHMSERPAYYSIGEQTVRKNLEELVAILPFFLETLVNLFRFFSKLHEKAPLEKRKIRGRAGLLDCLLDCLRTGRLSELDDIRKALVSAISKLRSNPDTPNEKLFET